MLTTTDPISVSDKTLIRLFKVRSREVSKPRDWFMFSRRFEIFDRDISLALLPRCLSNFRAMGQFQTQVLRLRDLTGSYDETSHRGLSDIETDPKPCHGGQWTVNASTGRRFHSVSFMNVVSGVSGRKYRYQLFNATIRHPTCTS